MAFLPTLGFEYNEREVTDTFRGYNHNLKIDEGEFFHTENLTSALSRCWPTGKSAEESPCCKPRGAWPPRRSWPGWTAERCTTAARPRPCET